MKKLATLLFAAALTLGATTKAEAVDIKMSGVWDFTFQWSQENINKNATGGYNGAGSSSAFYQRLRTQIDVVASETLRGVMLFEIGDTTWGKSNATNGAGRGAGGGIGADGVSIEVKRAYLDWVIPETELKIRMGIQGFSNPSAAGGYQVFSDDVAGIVASYEYNDMIGFTAWWLRPYSDNLNSNSSTPYSNNVHNYTNMDMFGLAIPITMDGFNFTPWGMYANIGRNIVDNDLIANASSQYTGPTSLNHVNALLPRWLGWQSLPYASKENATAWWAGLSGSITHFNPFTFAFDFNYGSVDFGNLQTMPNGGVNALVNGKSVEMKRSGWILSMLAEYKLDFMTPGIFFWYGSGDDSNAHNGSEMMPSIKASSQWTSFGQDAAGFNTANTAFLTGIAGTWGLGIQAKDLSFLEGLEHTLRVAYYRGTNNKSNVQNGYISSPWQNGQVSSGSAFTYMTTKDSAWEFNFDSSYEIYENLTLGLELGYIITDFDKSMWRAVNASFDDQNLYKVGIGLQYKF